MVIHGHAQSDTFRLLWCVPSSGERGHAPPSCFTGSAANKYPFHGLFSATFSTFLWALLVNPFSKAVPKGSVEELATTPDARRLRWALGENALDRLQPGMSYSAFGHEFGVNESIVYIK